MSIYRYSCLVLAVAGLVFFSCNKYKGVVDSRLTGTVYLHDTLNIPVITPLIKVAVYQNQGKDTSAFLAQALTDSLGHYGMPYFGRDSSVVFVNFVRNKTRYGGFARIGPANDQTIHQDLQIYLTYTNGLSLTFSGPGGPVSNYAFRLYTNRSAAVTDSVKFAYLSGTTGTWGAFHQYNLNANKYYIAAKDSVTGKKIKLLDSVIMTTGLAFKTVKIN